MHAFCFKRTILIERGSNFPKAKNSWGSALETNIISSFYWKAQHITSRSIAGLSAARNTEWAEKKIKTVLHVFYDSAEMYVYQ